MRFMGDWMMHRMIGESTEDYSASTAGRDRSFAGSRPHLTGTACGDSETDEYTADIGHKMAPKRTTRSTPATTTTPTTSVTDEQLKRLIDQGVADALAARDADRSRWR
ncbi:hypothetical protein Tco_0803611 [Tanacetum coccineum]|uniref:Uncharacterized protein n=1 Tax=Tanacetum coccineum TaxID=301880 RepID=A0ABQ5A290_9ASTR